MRFSRLQSDPLASSFHSAALLPGGAIAAIIQRVVVLDSWFLETFTHGCSQPYANCRLFPGVSRLAAGTGGHSWLPAGRSVPPADYVVGDTRNAFRVILAESDLMEHWYPRAVDDEHGGFHQNFARDWSPRPDDSKFLVYQARMTWTAAAFAVFEPAHREEFLGYARHGIAFLDTRDARPGARGLSLDRRPEWPARPRLGDEKHVYGISFVIYAASKVREVTGDELALKVASDAFDWLEQHAHDAKHGGYFEALERDGTPIVAWDETRRSPAAPTGWASITGSRR